MSMATLIPQFSSHRMVRDYVQQSYLPAFATHEALAAENYTGARALADWRNRVLAEWNGVQVIEVTTGEDADTVAVGDAIEVEAIINPGRLSAADLCVEAYHGEVSIAGQLDGAHGERMELAETLPDGKLRYQTQLTLPNNGYYGCTVRVYPSHPLLGNRFALQRLTWAPE
jgi:starch phosphorylase